MTDQNRVAHPSHQSLFSFLLGLSPWFLGVLAVAALAWGVLGIVGQIVAGILIAWVVITILSDL